MRKLITNGIVVGADGSTAADVLIEDETIAAIGSNLAATGLTADRSIDAAGRYLIPGGIDVHTHMELPFGGTFAKDTFETGTRAAHSGERRRSWTSRSSHGGSRFARASMPGMPRPRVMPSPTTAST